MQPSKAVRICVATAGVTVLLAIGVIVALLLTAICTLWVPVATVLFVLKVQTTILLLLLLVFGLSMLFGRIMSHV